MTASDPRRALRAIRRAIPPASRIAAAEALAARLLPTLPDGPIAGYWAIDGELPLHVLQLRLPPGSTWCLPVLWEPDQTLRFAPWRAGEALVSNRFGIPEPDVPAASLLLPADMAAVLMPLTGFDAAGRRLGMGGGWYDRSFAFRREATSPPLLVGIGFDQQQVDAVPVQPWDVVPDRIATPTRLIDRRCPSAPATG